MPNLDSEVASAEPSADSAVAGRGTPATRPAVLADRTMTQVTQALGAIAPCTRADLVRHSGLSRATVSKAVVRMVAAGLVQESQTGGPGQGRGRRPGLLQWCEDAGLVVGIDVGHSHVTVALATIDAALVAEVGAEVTVDTSPHETLDACRRLVAEALASCGRRERDVVGVAIGVPAPISDPSVASAHAAVLPGWREVDLSAVFADLFPVPVVVENDANLGALAEHRFGPREGSGDLIYVKISTGVGAGIISNGVLLRGRQGLAGEIGHYAVRPTGRLCRCGARGCLETVTSIASITEDLRPLHPDVAGVGAIVALLDAGDLAAQRSVADAGYALGQALAPAVCLLAPAQIVVNGLGDRCDRFNDGVTRAIREHVPLTQWQDLVVRASTFGHRNEILGALQLAASSRSMSVGTAGTGPR